MTAHAIDIVAPRQTGKSAALGFANFLHQIHLQLAESQSSVATDASGSGPALCAKPNLKLGFQIDPIVMLCLEPILRRLTILAHHDPRIPKRAKGLEPSTFSLEG